MAAESTSSNHCLPNVKYLPYIQLRVILWHILATGDTQNPHPLIIFQSCEKLRCDEEVLAGVFLASNLHHAFVHHALIPWIHALVDLIHDSERCSGQCLQGHQVEDGRHRALATRLPVGIEKLQGFIFSVVILLTHALHQ